MKQNRGLTVWTTAIPLYLELLAVSSISLMDVFFMSLVSDKAVAALGVCTQVLMIFTLLIRTLTGGAGAVAAQNLGAGDGDKANTAFIYTLVIAGLCGAVFALLLFLLRGHIGQWLGLNGETFDITRRYHHHRTRFHFLGSALRLQRNSCGERQSEYQFVLLVNRQPGEHSIQRHFRSGLVRLPENGGGGCRLGNSNRLRRTTFFALLDQPPAPRRSPGFFPPYFATLTRINTTGDGNRHTQQR
jgi:hypothetical protein